MLKDRGNYHLGQIAAQYLRKGAKVYVEGSLKTRKWQDQQGMERYTTEIIASELQMLDSKDQSQQPITGQQAQPQQYAQQGHQQRQPSHVEQSNTHHQAQTVYANQASNGVYTRK